MSSEPVLEPAAEPKKEPSGNLIAKCTAHSESAAPGNVESETPLPVLPFEGDCARDQNVIQAEHELDEALARLPDDICREYEGLDGMQAAAKQASDGVDTQAAFATLIEKAKTIGQRRAEIEALAEFGPVLAAHQRLEKARSAADWSRRDAERAARMERVAKIESKLRQMNTDDAFLAQATPLISRFPAAFEDALARLDVLGGSIRNQGGWLRNALRVHKVPL